MQSVHTAKYPNRLRDLIKEAGYTIREVSQEVEIPESTLRDWVAGNRPIPHNRLGAQEVTNFMAFYALQQEDDEAAVEAATAKAKEEAGH